MAQGFLLTNDTVSIYRLTRTGDKEAYSATPAFTGIKAQIMPAGSDILAVYPGESSYTLNEIFVYEMGLIKNGDKLVGSLGTFIIRGDVQKVSTTVLKYQQMVGEKVEGN
jgi:hypothetical protein